MKKILSMVLALALVLALTVSAAAISYNFDDEVIPAEWEQHWGGKNFSIVDGALFVDRLTDQNSYYSTGFVAGDFAAGVTYTVKVDLWFDDAEYGSTTLWAGLVDAGFDGTIYAEAQETLEAGTVANLVFTFTPDADVTNVWFSTKQNVWAGQGVDYYIDNVSITEGAEEAPADEVVEETTTEEAPADEVVEETTTEAPDTEEAPAETGLVLAVVPMLVAAVAVVASKRR